MKIGIFTDTWFHNPNGVTTSILVQYRELVRMGHEVTIIAPEGSRKCKHIARDIRVCSIPLPIVDGLRVALPVGGRALDKLDFDIVHSHTPFVMGMFAKRLAGSHTIPIIMTFHMDFQRYLHYVPVLGASKFASQVMLRWLAKTYQSADLIVAPSNYARSVIRGIGLENDVKVIPSGVDAGLLVSGPPSPCLWPTGSVKALCVGRLSAEKKFETLIRSIALSPMGHLVIVGNGPQKNELKDLAERLNVLRHDYRVTHC